MTPDSLIPGILDRIDVGVMILCRDMRIRYWNRFLASHTGRSQDELLGQGIFSAFPDLSEPWLRRKCEIVFLLKQFAFSGWEQQPFLFECPSRLPLTSGLSTMRQDCTFLPLRDEDGEVNHVCLIVKDATEVAVYRRQLEKALADIEEISIRDGLTGVFNRRHIEQLARTEFARHKRYGSPLVVNMLDIDRFKGLNDRYGHQFGDRVLRNLAECLSGRIRMTDFIGRYGGEEFLLIMPGIGGDQGKVAAELFRQTIESLSIPNGDEMIHVTASMGVCEAGPRHQTLSDVIGEADRALYSAKERGRNTVVLADFEPSDPGGEGG